MSPQRPGQNAEIAALLRELAEIVSFCIIQDDLIIRVEEGEDLVTDRARAMADRLEGKL
jgi:hypothetical protein